MTRDEHIARHGSLYSGNEIKAHNKRIAAKSNSKALQGKKKPETEERKKENYYKIIGYK